MQVTAMEAVGVTSSGSDAAGRVWFLDTVRYMFVLGVVILHAVEPQMTLENEWAVDDPRTTIVADQIVVFLDVILMSALFFVAGYFMLPTLARRGSLGFLRRKFWGLVVPGALVVVFLNPMWKYVFHLTRSWEAGESPKSYWEAWGFFLSSVRWLEVGNIHVFDFTLLHVWFIAVLIVFYAAVLGYLAVFREGPASTIRPLNRETSTRQVVWTIIGMTIITWAAAMILIMVVVPYQWIAIGPVLLFEVPYIVQYVAYFSLGVYAYRRQWLVGDPSLLGAKRYWLVSFAVLALVYQSWVQYLFGHPELVDSRGIAVGMWLVRLLLCSCCLVLILMAGMRYLNRPHPIHRHLAANSYRMYLLHPAVVVWVQLAFLGWTGLDGLTVLVGTCVLSLLATYLVSAFPEAVIAQRRKIRETASLST